MSCMNRICKTLSVYETDLNVKQKIRENVNMKGDLMNEHKTICINKIKILNITDCL